MKMRELFIPQRAVRIAILVCASVAIGCTKPKSAELLSERSKLNDGQGSTPTLSGHEQMLAILQGIRSRSQYEHPYIGSLEANELRQQLANLSFAAPRSVRWQVTMQLAQLELKLGNEQDSIEHFLWCQENLDRLKD
ncbi:MAG: hypothetical protein ACR2NZ_04870, partial [Rubripirellula sp.]